MRPFFSSFLLCLIGQSLSGADLEWVKVANNKRSFVLGQSGKQFIPWGFNYDHQEDSGRLIEDYWHKEWATLEQDFREMKQLGANVVRIHLQFGRLMKSANQANTRSLDQLTKLVKLAEKTKLYVDLTGLGCYHKKDVPAWYDKLDEQERWKSQAVFWEAVARRCARSPAIFCYNLMNEPVVPGNKVRKDWLGSSFGGKHFVQFITLSAANRPRHEIARKWINHLVRAIRKHDRRHLITVGLVPWSLDRRGLTSGFIPEKVAENLDFIAMHIYPEKGKLQEAMATIKGFAQAGKPVILEEIFPLKCSAKELGELIDLSKQYATGWLGFYWGKTPEEHRPGKSIRDAIVVSWLKLFREKSRSIRDQQMRSRIRCEGKYQHHLQGICTDNKNALFWSFTTTLVKTDLHGKVVKKIAIANHHGDLCFHKGRLFVAVNLGRFNDPKGNADSWIYVYKADDLSFLARHKIPQVFHGAGGIAYHDGKFIVVGGLPAGVKVNYVYEYDSQFKFIKKHTIKSGHTLMGIQTATFHNDHWWFGCYGNPKILLKTDKKFRMIGRFQFDCSLGLVGLKQRQFLVASGGGKGKERTGSVQIASENKKTGLALQSN